MFSSIVAFEVGRRLRMMSTYVYMLIFFLLGFLLMCAAADVFRGAAVSFGGAGKVMANSPYSVISLVALLAYLATPVVAALMGNAIFQDIEFQLFTLLYSYPLKKRAYLGGRYAGGIVVSFLVTVSIALGLWLASVMPFASESRIGPTMLGTYVWPYLLIVLPNLFFLGALFFALAALTRRMAPVYVTGVLLLLGYLIATTLSNNIENRTIAALIDPFGLTAIDETTRYWTIQERNTQFVPLAGTLLWNRLIWAGLGVAAIVLTFCRFSWDVSITSRGRVEVREETPHLDAPVVGTTRPGLAALLSIAKMELKETVQNVYFLVLLLAGVLFVVVAANQMNQLFGTAVYPVTGLVLEMTTGSFGLFTVVIIAFFAGEIVWRERDAHMASMTDALPVPTWVSFAGKFLALLAIPVILNIVLLFCGLAIQVSRGFHEHEWGLYFRTLFGLRMWNMWHLCALAMTLHVVVNNKYAGHFTIILYYAANIVTAMLDMDHNLYRFNGRPTVPYSDMNGFSHVIHSVFAFNTYWSMWSLVLVLLSVALWQRGSESDRHARLRAFRHMFRGQLRVTTGIFFTAAVALGIWIFHSTTIVNHYSTAEDDEDEAEQYEKRYKKLESTPQPKITQANVRVSLQPKERSAAVGGTFTLRNAGTQEIPVIYLNLWPRWHVSTMKWSLPATETLTDTETHVRGYTLEKPLQPGQEIVLTFHHEFTPHGIENSDSVMQFVENGTFFNSGFLPLPGYDKDRELTDDNKRKERGLPERPRMRDLDDPVGREHNYVTQASDWIQFEATISTDEDQIALAPGYLQREWTENGRRHFHYKMDAPILGFYAFLSARYAVKKDAWKDVALEIYHHPAHTWNLDKMMDGMKDALEYCSTQFSPYQHRQARILEFPRYETFAQSFPNTIPYSEGVGFIARVRPDDEKDIDYPYYITAHEIAHQWWAHQVIGADVQGATVLSETFSQYTALMVMKKRFGPDKMRRFLRYELDRYLSGRGLERKKELPLLRVENQPYIHYSKGSLVMYLLQDLLGESLINSALKEMIATYQYQQPPYVTARAFVEILTRLAPQAKPLVDDLFERITLFENRVETATWKKTGDNYEVTIHAKVKKLSADGTGQETPVSPNDDVDVGVFGKEGKELSLQRHHISAEESTFTVVVTEEPVQAGIDPYNKLIDRNPDDNRAPATAL